MFKKFCNLMLSLSGLKGIVNHILLSNEAMDDQNREIVKSLIQSLIAMLVITTAFYFWAQHFSIPGIFRDYINISYFKDILNIIIVILSAVIISIIFSICDRIGLLVPVERKLKDLIDIHKDTIVEMKNAQSLSQGFLKYSLSRNVFGFESVVGKVSISKEYTIIQEREMDGLILDIIHSLDKGDRFSFLNTYVDQFKYYSEAMEKASRRGAEFRLLLLQPDVSSAAVKSRWKDMGESEYDLPDIQSFVEFFAVANGRFLTLCKRMQPLWDAGKCGKFEVRFYRRSLNFPMILVERAVDGVQEKEKCYTGFYGKISSESMPYVEWVNGAFDTRGKFFALFNHKWDSCEKNTDIDTRYKFPLGESSSDISI